MSENPNPCPYRPTIRRLKIFYVSMIVLALVDLLAGDYRHAGAKIFLGVVFIELADIFGELRRKSEINTKIVELMEKLVGIRDRKQGAPGPDFILTERAP
jgi:hypothetical protein